MSISKLELFPWVPNTKLQNYKEFFLSISKLELFPWVAPQHQTTKLQQIWTDIPSELFPWVAPQHQTTKLQGILNENIEIRVVPLGCPPTPNYKTTGNSEWVYPNWSCSLGLPTPTQPQTTKLQGILNESIQIRVVPLGCPPTPN